jgi:endonuclease III
VYSGGLSSKKTLALRAALRKLRRTFGRCTLEPARAWSDEKLEAFLCTLPEIQRKSAYCIMLYSFGRQVFPADTHVGRVLSRLGPYRELGLSLEGRDHKKLQGDLADLVPPKPALRLARQPGPARSNHLPK